ncbi:MAG: beta-ketoacyl-[acyl-carrier-protein] synthase family protein [Kiritimatiellae bacterium]|nr:beta-ketoacyl-[acyl-carrier-protein] synthase family protein [Kiritimatiellia bacterium]
MKNPRRVVISGVGAVTPLGHGRDRVFAALGECKSGITGISLFDTNGLKGRTAAEIREFKIETFLDTQKTYLDRSSQFALAALALAMQDAGIVPGTISGERPALIFGTAWGSLETMTIFFTDFLNKGPRLVKPFIFPHAYANTAISLAAMEFGLDGYHLNFSSGTVAGACSILAAFDRVRMGHETVAFAGGYESLSRALFLGCEAAGELSPGEGGKERCAPFDHNRNGFVLGEGSGILVLEELEHAQHRGARIYAEVCGAGFAADNANSPRGEGLARAMRQAMHEASVSREEIDFVLANANGSILGDRREALAISTALGDNGPSVPVTSIKPLLGETLGASGSLQVVAALAAMETKCLPPILNLESPEEGLDLQFVRDASPRQEVRAALVNSTDPGGTAISFLLRSWKPKK